jgi:hypothetical protein
MAAIEAPVRRVLERLTRPEVFQAQQVLQHLADALWEDIPSRGEAGPTVSARRHRERRGRRGTWLGQDSCGPRDKQRPRIQPR